METVVTLFLEDKFQRGFFSYFALCSVYLQGFSFFHFSSPSSLLPFIYLEINFFIFVNSSWLTPTALIYFSTCFIHPPLPSRTILSATALSSPFSVVFICFTIFSLHFMSLHLIVDAPISPCRATTGVNLGAPNICLYTCFSIHCILSISFHVHVRTDDAYSILTKLHPSNRSSRL